MITDETLSAFLWRNISGYRRLHTLGTAQEAVTLAHRYNVSINDAHYAALLHDILRKTDILDISMLSSEVGLQILELCATIKGKPNSLAHAEYGGLVAEILGYNSNVCAAIRWHTTGRANMTQLEKVIYLADFIEPTRTWSDNNHMLKNTRSLAYTDIDKAVLSAMTATVEHLHFAKQGLSVDTHTIEGIEYFKNLCHA